MFDIIWFYKYAVLEQLIHFWYVLTRMKVLLVESNLRKTVFATVDNYSYYM